MAGATFVWPLLPDRDRLLSGCPGSGRRGRSTWRVGRRRSAALTDRRGARGLVFAGLSPDGVLPETVERPDHPWFIGVQFHPELKSKPFAPHPLFAGLAGAAIERREAARLFAETE